MMPPALSDQSQSTFFSMEADRMSNPFETIRKIERSGPESERSAASAFNMDDLIVRIDKKIAELSAEEKRERNKKLESVVEGIQQRRKELDESKAAENDNYAQQ